MKKSIFILLGLVALFSIYSPRISSSNPNFKVEKPEILQRGYQYPIYIYMVVYLINTLSYYMISDALLVHSIS